MLSSAIAWLFSSSSQQPISHDGTITKRELVAMVTTVATAFIFCPEPIKPFRDIGVILFLAWLTHILYSAWESIPAWVKNIVNRCRTWNGNSHNNSHSLTLDHITEQWSEIGSRIKAAVVVTWRVIQRTLLKGLQQFVRYLENRQEDKDPQPTPGPAQWYGLLVRTPAVHIYGPVSDHISLHTVSPEALPWQTHDVSSIPAMIPSLNFRTHLAFCLVHKAFWESRTLTLSQKMENGWYWDTRGQNMWCDKICGTDYSVREIISIECLGLVDAGSDPLQACQQYFKLLREDWIYDPIWWNDVDFALILGFLVIGHTAAEKCKSILEVFCQLREKEVIPRVQRLGEGFMIGAGLVTLAGAISVASAGLATPVAGPIFASGIMMCRGGHLSAEALHSVVKMKRVLRAEARQDLINRFPQLTTLFD